MSDESTQRPSAKRHLEILESALEAEDARNLVKGLAEEAHALGFPDRSAELSADANSADEIAQLVRDNGGKLPCSSPRELPQSRLVLLSSTDAALLYEVLEGYPARGRDEVSRVARLYALLSEVLQKQEE